MKMRICIVSRNIDSSNNYGSFEIDQAVALKEYGHDVYVLSLDFRSIRRKRKLGIYEDVCRGIPVMRCSVALGPAGHKLHQIVGSRVFAKAYRKIEKKAGGFDLVNPHFLNISFTTLYGLRNILGSDIPVVVTEHFSKMNEDRSGISLENIRKGEYVYKNANRIIAVSSALAGKIYNNFGVKGDVVFNVYESKIFNRQSHAQKDNSYFTFVSTGNLREIKRMDMLIQAFDRAFSGESDTRLFIFGDGPEMKKLETLIHNLDADDKIFLMGRRSRTEIAEFYEDADAFVLASKRETFGVVFLEAMAMGMPVISTKSGGPEDFIIPETGLLVNGDVDSLEEGLKQIRYTRDTYDDDFISKYARKICNKKEIAEQLTAIFEKVI